MNLIEIVPAHRFEHKREIRRMAKGLTGTAPQVMALLEIGCVMAACSVIAGFAWMFVGWWLM